MKKLITAIILSATTLLGFSQKKGTAEITIQTKIYCDHCGACEDCKPNIVNSVENLNGVKAVDLNIPAMTITVVYSPQKTSPDAIRKAITEAGYEADGLPADPIAYEALDGCCKKN